MLGWNGAEGLEEAQRLLGCRGELHSEVWEHELRCRGNGNGCWASSELVSLV